jgi:mono/diheme cytochrome c family protein
MIEMRSLFGWLPLIAAIAGAGLGLFSARSDACAAAQPTSFSEDVMPIFKGRCVGCHQAGQEGFEKSGLDLTSYAGLMKGTKHGAMVVARDPDSSNLVWLLDWRASAELRMPHGKKQLSSCDRATIRAWIREGAKDN